MGQSPCYGKGRRLRIEQRRNEEPSRTEERRREVPSRNEEPRDEEASRNEEPRDEVPSLRARTSDASSEYRRDRANSDIILFTYHQLADATNNFRRESIVGEGGFGPVFKGKLKTGQIVAAKQLYHLGRQGSREFLVEILMLSLLRHPNVIQMIGYCEDGDQRLIVYEFMPFGSLEYCLHDLRPGVQPLDWNSRMAIAAGTAKALNYLHYEANPPVIYRDLKSSNILLGEGFHPKLSDFGLAKFGPDEDNTNVSTVVMGTHGYCAPEYSGTGQLTFKCDVYSFGIVLLELISGQPALDRTRDGRMHLLVEWVRFTLMGGSIVDLADPLLEVQFQEAALRRALKLALDCIRDDPTLRPSMRDVVSAMEILTSNDADEGRDRSGQPEAEGGRSQS